jgi:hypothetical protein
MSVAGALGSPGLRNLRGREALLLAFFIVVGPVLLTLVAPALDGLARSGGWALYADVFGGRLPFTDVGWEVASARGLLDPGRSMYESVDALAPLIGMNAYDVGAHTHPPTSAVMWTPLAIVPYGWWIPFYVCLAVTAVAVSMRVLGVGPSIAYPVAALLALTPAGMFSMTTTYPLMALALALAWRYRDVPMIAGPMYAVLAASRGVAGVLLVYPMLRRQWRTLALAVGLLVLALVVALGLEGDVVSRFVNEGRVTIDSWLGRTFLFTPEALLTRRGIWTGAWYAAALVLVGLGLYLRRESFWLLVWLSLALAPIAWAHSIVATIPLLVVMWFSGRLGQVLTLLAAGLTLAVAPFTIPGPNSAWIVVLLTTGIGVLACPLGARQSEPAES